MRHSLNSLKGFIKVYSRSLDNSSYGFISRLDTDTK